MSRINMQQSWNQIARQDNQTNLKISESNNHIAEATKRDSHQMRKISVLTLIFLPATFVAVRFGPPIYSALNQARKLT
jgi:Mg2+ and Co2+ transporter CorA